jgi:multiple sugar transport system ATP-binding protein
VLQHPFFEFQLDDARSKTLQQYKHSQLILGVRPENILLTDQSNAIFSQEALVVEPQGSHQVVAIDLDGQVIKVVAPAHPKVFPGEMLHLTFQQERIHAFDLETQKRI